MRAHALLLATAAVVAVLLIPPASAATATVNLQTADPFAILAGAGISNTGATTVTGDVGSHPTSAQSGFGSVTIIGTNHHDDAVTAAAKDDLVEAYDDAANRTGGTPIVGGELGGLTLTPGVYVDNNAPDSLAITGTLTLDGLHDPDSVFIFQSGSTLITASASNVVLINGAQACNIFWQVGSSATLGTGSHLEGTLLALTSITLDNSATVNGRVLARNGAVTLDTNTIQIVPCASAPTPTPTPTSTATPTPSPSTPTPPPSTTPPPTMSPTPPTPNTTATAPIPPSTTTPPPAIPFFPTAAALAVGGLAGVGGALLIMRRRRA